MVTANTVRGFERKDVPRELLVGPSLFHLFRGTLFDWICIAASIFLMSHTPIYFYPLYAMIVAGRLHAFGVIIHDLSHSNLRNKPWSFRVLEFFAGYIIGTSANAMAYHHIRHHRHTLDKLDPYFDLNKKCSGFQRFLLTFKKGPFFVLFWVVRSFFAPFALLIPSLRNFYGRFFLQDVSGEELTNSEELRTCMIEDLPIMAFHSVLLYFALTHFPFLIYGYYFAAPVGGVFCIYRLLTEHEYELIENQSIYNIIDSTFDHHMRPWEKAFFGPHNIGFHCMHHVHPSVGFHALPKLQQWYSENSDYYNQNLRKAL